MTPIGDILTLVQAKRYATGNKIDVTPVAALYGISAAESANKALFVTISNYLPVARRFANRVSRTLELAEQNDIANWCARATAGVIVDKSSLVANEAVRRLITDLAGQRDHRLLCTSFGYNATHNDFALVIKESSHAALLMRLGASQSRMIAMANEELRSLASTEPPSSVCTAIWSGVPSGKSMIAGLDIGTARISTRHGMANREISNLIKNPSRKLASVRGRAKRCGTGRSG